MDSEIYSGIDKDSKGGMSSVGKIIRDAWIFGLLPETETCEGWTLKSIDQLLHKVNDEWDKYGCMVSNLPQELRERHKRIYDEAIAKAREKGWNGELEVADD